MTCGELTRTDTITGRALGRIEDCDVPIMGASRSFPAITSRGANGEPSGSSLVNLTFHGHTDWEDCRYTHFEIRLSTGKRTQSTSST